jgi:hypothetical protein
MVWAFVLAAICSSGPKFSGPNADLARAIERLGLAQDVKQANWQPVADALAKRIGRTDDWSLARRRLAAVERAFLGAKNRTTQFYWYDIGPSMQHSGVTVIRVAGRRPGLLGNASVGAGRMGHQWTFEHDCLLWFERRAGRWAGQMLFVGSEPDEEGLTTVEPQEALTTEHYLAVVGRNYDNTNYAGGAALLFKRKGDKWVFKQKIVSEGESWDTHFGRVRGRKDLARVLVDERCYFANIDTGHGEIKRHFLDEYRLIGGRYRYQGLTPVPSAVATLDDMIQDVHKHRSVRGRSATASLARRFAALIARWPSRGFECSRKPEDEDTKFELAGTETVLHFRHVGRGWILSSMRKAPPHPKSDPG